MGQVRVKKLPITIKEILETDSCLVGVMVEFADGSTGACLIPESMLTEDNIRISAAVTAAVWEMLRPPLVTKKPKGKGEVIDLDATGEILQP